MSFQYIHTSAKRGLEPGKSGFCCVARDRDVPPDLIAELESQSRYQTTRRGGAPLVLRYRIASLRSGDFHILSRIQETRADYSKRNNHLAHHLAFEAAEIPGLPNPAAILLNWRRWKSAWEEPPRILERSEAFDLQDIDAPWGRPDPLADFPALVHGHLPSTFVFAIELRQERPLVEHLRQQINLLPTRDRWNYAFTNCLLPTDRPQDFVWSATLRDLHLPYEVDTRSRLLKRERPAPARTLKRARPAGEPKPAEPEPPPSPKSAPTVEIPEDYDPRKRKRPKRKLGPREFSRAINLAIAAGALVCALLVVVFYRIHRDSSLGDAPTAPALADGASFATYRRLWQDFQNRGFPRAEIDAVRPAVAFLAETGLDEPTRILAFLDRLADAEGSGAPLDAVPVPKPLLKQTGGAATLALSTISYPALRQTALLPAPLLPQIRALQQASPPQLPPLDTLPAAQYTPELLAAALDAFLFELEADYQQIPAPARNALDTYFAQRQAIAQNPQYAPILDLPSAFGLPDAERYLAFDADGLLLPNAPVNLSLYLKELLRHAVAASDAPALDSPEFQAALRETASQSLATPLQTALALYAALQELDLQPASANHPWPAARDAWRDAFVRSDLMEQTILSYTLEALETAKIELAQARSAFSDRQLETRRTLQRLRAQAQQIAAAARAASPPEDWVVIGLQSSKVQRSQP